MKQAIVVTLVPVAAAFQVPRAQDVLSLLHTDETEDVLLSRAETAQKTRDVGTSSDLHNYCAGGAAGDKACEVEQKASSLEDEMLAVLGDFSYMFGDDPLLNEAIEEVA